MARQSIPVLVTRPQAEAESFAAALSARFGDRVRPVLSPLMAPRVLHPELPDGDHAAVAFTSAQAILAARQLGLSLPSLAWCVGRRTAEVAAGAGFTTRSADGDADDLADAILKDPPDGRILYLRGVDTAGNLLERLTSSGVSIDVAIVYVQEERPLTAEALALLSSPGDVLVPLFSPRSASLFRAALPQPHAARLHLAAMSEAVARPLRDLPHSALLIAQQPDAPAMLDAVDSLLVGLAAP